MYLVEDLCIGHPELNLKLVAGSEGLDRRIVVPEAQRPGLSLAGYLKGHAGKRIHIFGKVEIEYLQTLKPQIRIKRLKDILSMPVPAVIVARGLRPPKELMALCEQNKIPLFRTNMSTMNLISKLTLLLTE